MLVCVISVTRLSQEPLLKAYPVLLSTAEKKMPRPVEMPLSHFAQKFELIHPGFDGLFIQLTMLYEEALYGSSQHNREKVVILLKQVARKLQKVN